MVHLSQELVVAEVLLRLEQEVGVLVVERLVQLVAEVEVVQLILVEEVEELVFLQVALAEMVVVA